MQADEFVVYSPHQQRMRYLVEFSLPDEDSSLAEDSGEVTASSEAGERAAPVDDDEDTEAVDNEGQ